MISTSESVSSFTGLIKNNLSSFITNVPQIFGISSLRPRTLEPFVNFYNRESSKIKTAKNSLDNNLGTNAIAKKIKIKDKKIIKIIDGINIPSGLPTKDLQESVNVFYKKYIPIVSNEFKSKLSIYGLPLFILITCSACTYQITNVIMDEIEDRKDYGKSIKNCIISFFKKLSNKSIIWMILGCGVIRFTDLSKFFSKGLL